MFFQWDVLKNTDSFVVKDPTDHLATQPPGAGRGSDEEEKVEAGRKRGTVARVAFWLVNSLGFVTLVYDGLMMMNDGP